MSKARTLADFISDGSEFADGTISVAEVSGAAPLASPTFTGTASGTFSGPLTGNVTGNVTGDLTGDVTGNVTGNLTGNVTGDVAGDIDLSAITATIADTAVDIFVYDTRKDSDGGAWRKRTQHTSWYNETLNTSTRGSRKEFPAVAVIVADNSTSPRQVTIYDGDDPDLPMWMVFKADGGVTVGTDRMYLSGSVNFTGVSMLNGKLAVSSTYSNPRSGIDLIDFLSDSGVHITNASNNTIQQSQPIAQRNTLSVVVAYDHPVIVNDEANDVAMTVLPNAPIDAATGLPVPTIAVATNGGTSVIKDDGTVVDITYSNFNAHGGVAFVDGNVLITNDNGGTNNRFQKIHTIPSSDLSAGTGYEGQQSSSEVVTFTGDRVLYNHDFSYSYNRVNHTTDGRRIADNVKSFGHTGGFVQYDGTRDTGVMFNNATSSFATGYQVGDIKLATLSDTDATNVTGSELVTNGTFDTDTSGWTGGTHGNGTTLSLSGNELVIASDASSYGEARQSITLEANTKYVFTVYIAYSTQIYYTRYRLQGTDFYQTLLTDGSVTSLGWQTVTFTTGSTVPNDIELILSARNDVVNQRVDNISIRKAEEDRSVNNNGLQVFGTVTKSAVSSGADLVAYSGFSSSNYLDQPYNSDLNFGTGDFSIITWAKTNGSVNNNQTLFNMGYYSGSTWEYWIALQILGSNGNIRFATAENGAFTTEDAAVDADTGTWTCLAAVRRNGVLEVYKDGTFLSSDSGTVRDLTIDANAKSRIGLQLDGGSTSVADDTSIALLRVSATAPSPEQIKKIYEDEKVLFQDGAQATLYGSSDAVTALAYDDSNGILSVGTSAGRSDFQGLRRVNNTTNAVGAAISASNGLIVEE